MNDGMKRIEPQTEQAVRMFLDRLRPDYDLIEAILYGSRARGDHEPDSGADVALILRGERQRSVPVKLAMSDVAYDVLLETGINISPMPIWLEEWEHPERTSNPDLLANILRDGIRLGPPEQWNPSPSS